MSVSDTKDLSRLDDEVHVYPLGGEPWRSLAQEVRHGD